jgi:hypothetical protein
MKGMSQLTTTVVQLDVYVKLDIHTTLLIKHLGHLNWYDFLSIVAHRILVGCCISTWKT